MDYETTYNIVIYNLSNLQNENPNQFGKHAVDYMGKHEEEMLVSKL